MKNACIAGVFLHPDRRKNRRLPPVARQPPIPPTGHAFSAGDKPPPIPPPAQDAFMHKPADHQPETAAIREKSGKRHRHPEHKPSAIPQSITSPDRSLPPPDTVISPNRPFRQRTDIFCMDAREYGQEKHADRRNGGKNRGYGSMQTVTEPFITGCSGSIRVTVPFREWLTPENGTRIAGGSERRKKCLVPARSCPMLFCPFVQHMRYFTDCKGKMTLADRLVHRKRG